MGSTHSHASSSRSKRLASTINDSPPPPYTTRGDSDIPFTHSGLTSRPSYPSNWYSESDRRYNLDAKRSLPSTNPFLDLASQGHRRANRSNSVSLSDGEDQLELLKKFDTVIVVDDSGSMYGSRWREARDALAGIASLAAQYDANGIDIHFLNSSKVGTDLKSAAQVERIFDTVRPQGLTPTGRKLEELLLDYLFRYEGSGRKPKPVNFVILTDGAPSDEPLDVIIAAARRLDAQHAPLTQVGIQFVQVGDDHNATRALNQMDNDLSKNHNIRDMVDTTPYMGQPLDSELLGKILLGGINRRVDRISRT